MQPYDILDQLIGESRELYCLHCNTRIEPTYATIHRGECYCAKCQDWNMLSDCRKHNDIQIFYNEKNMTNTSQFHNYSLTSTQLEFEKLIIPLLKIKEIRKNDQILYKKKEKPTEVLP